MAIFDTTDNTLDRTIDHVTGNKIKDIIEKYLGETINQELCDKIMEEVKAEFGEEHLAQVHLDDETNEIEIVVRDRNDKWIKCSSLTLFPEEV
jgi:actin-like ATPase involved in cell morphogenesis